MSERIVDIDGAATADDCRRLINQLEAAVKILKGSHKGIPWVCACGCPDKLRHAHHVARSANTLFRARGEGRSGKGGHGDPTANAALDDRPDATALWLAHLSDAVRTTATSLSNLTLLTHEIGSITISTPYTAGRGGQGNCEVCDHIAPGTDTDRLRSGFCGACYKAWDRAGRPDRAQFKRDRRVVLAAAKEAARTGKPLGTWGHALTSDDPSTTNHNGVTCDWLATSGDGRDIDERLNPGHQRPA